MPFNLRAVARIADIELDILFVTPYGPILLGPFSRVISPFLTIILVEAPPDPATIPILGESKSFSSKFAIFNASNAAKYEYPADSPINLNSFLSIC